MKRALTLALLLAAGCSSPELADSTAVKIFAAVPGLTYVDGDPEAGTTTMLSLPLLTYRSTERVGSKQTARTCVLPLLGSFESTRQPIEVEWADAPSDPPDGWWEHRDGLTPKKEQPSSGAASQDARRRAERAPRRAEREPRRAEQPRGGAPAPRRKRTGVTAARPAPSRMPALDRAALEELESASGGRAVRRDGRLILKTNEPVEVKRHLPQETTDADILFPLVNMKVKRPGVVVAETKDGREQIYQVGDWSDALRVLPLFSFERDRRHTSFTIWPLFSGYERDEDGAYLRLFWFIKIPL